MSEERTLPPGRELDVLVAEKVVGLSPVQRPHSIWYPDQREWFPDTEWAYSHMEYEGETASWRRVPHYSTRIEDAWRVVEHLRDYGPSLDYDEWGWWCHFKRRGDFNGLEVSSTAPHAICLAALRVIDCKGAGDSPH